MIARMEYTVAELRDRAGDEAFRFAGRDIVDMDGPHEDEWSLYATVTLDNGDELETILHHRAGKPLSGECSCPQADDGALCAHIVWVGLVHLGLDPAASRFTVFYTKLHNRLLRPLMAADRPPAPLELRQARRAIDRHIGEYLDLAGVCPG